MWCVQLRHACCPLAGSAKKATEAALRLAVTTFVSDNKTKDETWNTFKQNKGPEIKKAAAGFATTYVVLLLGCG